MEITNGFAEYIGRQLNKEKEMTNRFKAGDKVVALKGFHTIKVGDILTVDNITDCWFQAVECRGYNLSAANYELYKPTFKNMKGMFSNMKFRVSSPEHSKEIQEALFEMGYNWHSDPHPIRPSLDSSYITWICANMKGELALRYGDRFEQEHTIETTKLYKLIPVVPEVTVESPKETLTIDGKTYNKEAVLKRLAELEEVK